MFKCSLTNTEWIDFLDNNLYIPEPCDFFQKNILY